jgi:hypothetical protein
MQKRAKPVRRAFILGIELSGAFVLRGCPRSKIHLGACIIAAIILASLLNGPIGAVQDQRCPDGSIVGWAGSATDTPTE